MKPPAQIAAQARNGLWCYKSAANTAASNPSTRPPRNGGKLITSRSSLTRALELRVRLRAREHVPICELPGNPLSSTR
jgi:hypothetical protein